jgi:hypothetical protein
MRSLTAQPLLSFDGRRYSVGDAVLGGLLRGRWQSFERDLALGVACECEAAARGETVDATTLRELGTAYRTARGLVAADDFTSWLARRSLSVSDWSAYLCRGLLRSQNAERLADVVAWHPPQAADVTAAARAEALCSGVLATLGHDLILCCAAARALAEQEPGDDAVGRPPAAGRAERLVAEALASATAGLADMPAGELLLRAKDTIALEDAHTGFAAQVAGDAAIARWLRVKRLQLLRYAWDDVIFASEAAAREAALLVREDGMALADVARAAGAESVCCAGYASELNPSLAPRLVGAVPGELVGVDERVPPSSADPELRDRAVRAIVADRLERHIVGRVVWHVDA